MTAITIPDNVSPADLVGQTDLLPGQGWLNKETILAYASLMQEGCFPWDRMQQEQPMAIEVGTNGQVLTQGHHRWVAARLAGIAIPVEMNHRRDYLEAGLAVPFARTWAEVVWREART